MPKNENFWNPYRMITPLLDKKAKLNKGKNVKIAKVEREKPLGHEKFYKDEKGEIISGEIVGEVEALTKIYIGTARETYDFFKSNGKYCIPATSFKGMLRSFIELIGKGCDVTSADKCVTNDSLCIACRLFGMTGKDTHTYQGKVYISDLEVIERSNKIIEKIEVILSSPNPNHEAFYGEKINRKFYHHQIKHWNNIESHTKQRRMISTIFPLPKGTKFNLNIRFENLTIKELGILLYALELEGDKVIEVPIDENGEKYVLRGIMAHKIGGAKPLGYGSIKITLDVYREDFYYPFVRYSKFNSKEEIISEETWHKIWEEVGKYYIDGEYDNEVLNKVRAMLLFSEEDDRLYRYPKNEWFKSHSRVGLKPIYDENDEYGITYESENEEYSEE